MLLLSLCSICLNVLKGDPGAGLELPAIEKKEKNNFYDVFPFVLGVNSVYIFYEFESLRDRLRFRALAKIDLEIVIETSAKRKKEERVEKINFRGCWKKVPT